MVNVYDIIESTAKLEGLPLRVDRENNLIEFDAPPRQVMGVVKTGGLTCRHISSLNDVRAWINKHGLTFDVVAGEEKAKELDKARNAEVVLEKKEKINEKENDTQKLPAKGGSKKATKVLPPPPLASSSD